MSGKAYHNKKKKVDQVPHEEYPTPRSLVWELIDQHPTLIDSQDILEPCAGRDRAIVKALQQKGYTPKFFDLNFGSPRQDFFEYNTKHDIIISNVPFSQWDEFVLHAKQVARKVILIGRTNYYGTYKRDSNGVWDGLKHMCIFNRMCDYETPVRNDGHFHVGGLVTGWFVWERGYTADWTGKRVDVQKYATLGQVPREKCERCGLAITTKGLCKSCKAVFMSCVS